MLWLFTCCLSPRRTRPQSTRLLKRRRRHLHERCRGLPLLSNSGAPPPARRRASRRTPKAANSRGNDHDWNDIVFKTSADDGATWSPLRVAYSNSTASDHVTIGNPSPVVIDGAVVLVFCRNNKQVMTLRSADGIQWDGAPTDVTAQALGANWSARVDWIATGPPQGLVLPSSDGGAERIVIQANYRGSGTAADVGFAILSDDGGSTWRPSAGIVPACNEGQVAPAQERQPAHELPHRRVPPPPQLERRPRRQLVAADRVVLWAARERLTVRGLRGARVGRAAGVQRTTTACRASRMVAATAAISPCGRAPTRARRGRASRRSTTTRPSPARTQHCSRSTRRTSSSCTSAAARRRSRCEDDRAAAVVTRISRSVHTLFGLHCSVYTHASAHTESLWLTRWAREVEGIEPPPAMRRAAAASSSAWSNLGTPSAIVIRNAAA